MSFTTNFRAYWTGTNATIPANWSEDTAYSGKYIQGGAADFSAPANGGASIHNHTMPAHTHTSSHTHKFSSGSYSNEAMLSISASARPTKWTGATINPHSHGTLFSSSASIDLALSSTVVLSTEGGSAKNRRPILIKPDDNLQDLADDIVCYSDSSLLTDFSTVASMDDRFNYITGSGSDADMVSDGGSDTHQHTTSSHTHSVASHNHGSDQSANGGSTNIIAFSPTITHAKIGHYHMVTSSSDGGGTSGTTAPSSDAVSNEPAYVKLLAIQNTSGGDISAETAGLVMMYVGAVGSIPSGWTLMDGTGESNHSCIDRQVMGTTTVGEIGQIGGSNSHTHVMAHVHSNPGGTHTHSATSEDSDVVPTQQADAGSKYTVLAQGGHNHTWTWESGGGGNSGNADAITDGGDSRWHYRTLIYIKKTGVVAVTHNIIFFGANI